jgi:hypothetical protein
MIVVGLAAAAPAVAAPAGTVHYPDLQTLVPTNQFSVVTGTAGREFRYTHQVYNAGPGPLEIQPEYSSTSGNYQGQQQFFTHDANNQWSMTGQRRVPDPFIFHAAHGHFHFPLASFGLYAVAADGSPGAPVTLSPKNGFCIADSYMWDTTVPHAGTFVGAMGSCADPLSLRGMTVGAVDEYDYRDPGQAIPFAGVPDGTYWFRAITDPNNDVQEADESNNETDVKVTIAGSTVTAGQVTHPSTTPPAATMTAPLNGARVQGQVTMTANAPAGASVQFIVDGTPVGTATQTAAPYSISWNSTTVVDGDHWLATRVTDAQGRVNTSDVVAATVANAASPPPATGALGVDVTASRDGSGTITTPAVSTLTPGDLLLAFVASDGPNSAGAQTVTVSGGNLPWSLVKRVNTRAGTSEIWKAVAPSAFSNLTVTSTQASGGFHQSLHLVGFTNAGGVGATGGAAAPSGAPAVSLVTSQAGSWVWGVGNDWDAAKARVPAVGQVLGHQWVDTGVGDTFWMQNVSNPTPAAGTTVTLTDTAPTTDQYNFASAEVLAGGPVVLPPPDTTAPQVRVSDPVAGATVSGIVQVGAVASDNVGVTGVQFKLDGQPLGAPVTAPPFSTAWDTRTATQGSHALTAEARDAAGNVAVSTGVTVTVDNSAPPPGAITVDKTSFKHAKGTLAAPALTTTAAGEQLLAFVALDGPNAAAQQQSTVTGGGLAWTLVKRSNTQAGVSEIWTARAGAILTNAVVTATPQKAGYDGMLHVMTFKGASGTGVAGASGAASGAPDIYLPGIQTGSWVFAVGNDWDRAVGRTPISGQPLQHQWIDTGSGDTFWVQSTAAPNTAPGLVTIHDNAPTNDRWNFAAVELVAAPATAAAAPTAAAARDGARRLTTGATALSGVRSAISAALRLCDLTLARSLPSVQDVQASARRDSALRRAGRRQARRHTGLRKAPRRTAAARAAT